MKKFLITLLIPFFTLLAWTISLEAGLQNGQEIRIKIRGYDPRDLLAGHFIRYSLDFGEVQPCASYQRGPACICLMKDSDSNFHHAVTSSQCDTDFSYCNATLRGNCEGLRFTAGIERYSIPESLSSVLMSIPDNSSVVVAINRQGQGQVKRVLVEERSIEEYAEDKIALQATASPSAN